MRRNTFQEEAIACVKAVSTKRIGCLKNSETGSVLGGGSGGPVAGQVGSSRSAQPLGQALWVPF